MNHFLLIAVLAALMSGSSFTVPQIRPDGSAVEWDRIEPAMEMAAELVTGLPDNADVLPRPFAGSATDVLLQELLVGGQVDIDLPELGATGAATIIAVKPCPTIEPDDGTGRRLITSVYRHTAKTVFDVRLTGEESIGATGNHPFWSEDRQAFVRADELRIGERLRQASGATTTVVSVVQRPDPAPVYNIEVDAEHVYYVGTNGVLVHNATCAGRLGKQTRLRELAVDPSVSNSIRGWLRQELNSITRGTRTRLRVPPGMNLAHRRGFEAKLGYGYSHSDLQDIMLHRLQHAFEGY